MTRKKSTQRKSAKKPPQEKPPQPTIAEKKPSTKNRALALLRDEDFFGKLRNAIARAGIVGEVRNALAIYIIAISSLLERPLSAILKGRSSSGKNKVASVVLSLLPRSAVREITSSSKTAWNYSGDDFKHRVVYLPERNDVAGAVHPVRLLISEGKLVRTVTVRQGLETTTKKFVAEGPISAITTTTRDRIEIDDETRNVSIWVDDSSEQTRRIIERQLSPLPELDEDELEVWREAYKMTRKRSSVAIDRPDWLKEISDKVYTDDLRVRRYFPAFLTAIDTLAVLRSFQNHPDDYEDEESIPVDFDDYAKAECIFNGIFVDSLLKGDEKREETREAVQKISEDQDGIGADAEQLAKYLGISPDKAYARLRDALKSKAIVRANDPEKNNRKLYVSAEPPRFVPDPRDVAPLLRLKKPFTFVHPVTGKKLLFGGK
jgi:hypothetical protein